LHNYKKPSCIKAAQKKRAMSEVVIAAQQQAVACPEYNTKMGTE
jgi:hypothetical protein